MQLSKRLCASLVTIIAAAGCGGGASAPARAASSRPITINDVVAIDQTGPPVWAPDSREVAFQWGLGAERDFWSADATASTASSRNVASASVRQLAPLTGRADATVSPDWQTMAYVSKKHIWTIPLRGGRPVRVTTAEGKYSGLNWSPDSKRLAFIVDRNDQDDIGVGFAAGGAVTMIAATPPDEDSPIWSPASDRLAFLRRSDDWSGYDIWVSGADAGHQRSIVREAYQKGVEEFHFGGNDHWSPDGTRIAYLSSRTGYNHVWVASVDGGEPQELTTGAFVDYDPSWSPAGDRILFVSSRAGDLEDRHVWTVSVAGGQPVRLSADGFSASPAWSRDGKRIAYLSSSAIAPPEVLVQNAQPAARAARLTESRPDPELTAGFVEPQAVVYKSRDGMTVRGVMLKPREAASGSRPALMFFHGKGGINLKGWGGLPNYAFHQYLVQQGYAVMFVNWRGTHIGYGSAYEQANYRDYGGGELDDVVAAAQLLQREAGVDPARIACWGESYGGYMTMLAVTKTPEVCSAGISLYGVSDWAAFLTESKRKLWRMRLVSKLGDPAKDPELWNKSAAIKFAAQARAPLLILQGLDDDGVMPVQGESLYDAMRQLGKTVEYVAFVGEGHGFRHTGSQRDLYDRVGAFLARYNRPTAAVTSH